MSYTLVIKDSFLCSDSTHHQVGMDMALMVTPPLCHPILCRQLVQKARHCSGHQEKQHEKYHEYPSKYCSNGNFN
jgi:hypothetical protein